MKIYQIATIPGDGIGKEVVPEAQRVLHTLAEIHGGVSFEFTEFPYGSEYYVQTGKMMPDDGLDHLKHFDAIFLGAVGDPEVVPDHISLWELLIKIRRSFEQVLNVRPAKLLKGISSPLRHPNNFDIIVIRENSEGEYSSVGGRMYQGDDEIAIQNSFFSRKATERAIKYAFELALKRKNQITSATKSNGIYHTMPFWDEIFADIAKDYPRVVADSQHIDALSAAFVTKPETFDIVVASNLFGDILTDIGASIMGSVGIAPAANINVNGKYPSMFEPVHGSAPDIVGTKRANPIGQIWTSQMMLNHFGEHDLAKLLLEAIEDTTSSGIVTPDLGGQATTNEVTDELIKHLKAKGDH